MNLFDDAPTIGWLDEDKVYHFAVEIIPPYEYSGERPPIFRGSSPLLAADGFTPGPIERALSTSLTDIAVWCLMHGVDPESIDARPLTEEEVAQRS